MNLITTRVQLQAIIGVANVSDVSVTGGASRIEMTTPITFTINSTLSIATGANLTLTCHFGTQSIIVINAVTGSGGLTLNSTSSEALGAAIAIFQDSIANATLPVYIRGRWDLYFPPRVTRGIWIAGGGRGSGGGGSTPVRSWGLGALTAQLTISEEATVWLQNNVVVTGGIVLLGPGKPNLFARD